MSKKLTDRLLKEENQKLIDFAEWIIDNCHSPNLMEGMPNRFAV